MVKIIKAEAPGQLTGRMKTVFDLVGVAIAKEPLQVKGLLQQFSIQVSEKPTSQELTDKIVLTIERNDEKFNVALAKLLTRQVMPEGYDQFMGGGQGGGGGVTVGADPISAIAGAIGSVANLFGSAQKKKLMKQQASSQTMNTLLAYRAQQEKEVADAASKSRAHANQMAMLKIVGLLAVGLLVGWFFLRSMNKSQTY